MSRNRFALLVVIVILVGFPAGVFGYQAWRTNAAGMRVIDLVAGSPASGGFVPDRLVLRVGEPVRLRISSPDVVHGMSIPGLGVDIQEILPGRVVEVDITPKEPGRYAFACTRWCSVDHWRMRGVIEVQAADGRPAPAATAAPPLYQQLGVNLDAMPPQDGPAPVQRPSAARGAGAGVALPGSLLDATVRVATAPADAFRKLRADPAKAAVDDGRLWDALAWAWLHAVKPETLARAAALYSRDCAACHGPEGKGDGPAGRELPGLQKMDPMLPAGPADFTDPVRLLGASDVLLQGKILRGGMGTGMPEFGSLYTDDELWAMVAYIRTFLFQPTNQQTNQSGG